MSLLKKIGEVLLKSSHSQNETPRKAKENTQNIIMQVLYMIHH